MSIVTIAIEAKTLTPFAYHSLMVQSGTATIPELISDRAVAFGLALTLGMMSAQVTLPTKNYREHLGAMPYRTSLFITDKPKLLMPLTRRLNLDAEAGLHKKIQDVAKKGNLKDFFYTQEVPPGQVFQGAMFGLDRFDPFVDSNREELVIRVGLHRGGMVRLRKVKDASKRVRLNASTAWLFGREMPMDRYCLHDIQVSPWLSLDAAASEVAQWK
jgi:hypothetical protein